MSYERQRQRVQKLCCRSRESRGLANVSCSEDSNIPMEGTSSDIFCLDNSNLVGRSLILLMPFQLHEILFPKEYLIPFFTLCGVATSPRTFTLSISFHKKTRELLFCQDFPRFLFILSFSILAEREGFEPSRRSLSRLLALQASAFDHSATSPHTVLNLDDRSILDKAGGESGI